MSKVNATISDQQNENFHLRKRELTFTSLICFWHCPSNDILAIEKVATGKSFDNYLTLISII
jgi:hypothetical protein